MKSPVYSDLDEGNVTFVSITLIRAAAIVGIIMENYFSALQWHDSHQLSDDFASLFQTVMGSFVQLFFVLSGYGLTLSYFRKPPASWASWAKRRLIKILYPYWIAVIVTFTLAKLSNHWVPGSIPDYSWTTLFAYLTFTRNFNSSGFTLNPSFWFMPVIVGLYIIYPLLIQVLKRFGLAVLIVSALFAAYGSIALCVLVDYPLAHQNALPVFFVCHFALGMALGKLTQEKPQLIRRMMEPRYFFGGLGFYALSAITLKFQVLGNVSASYNDIITAVGLYLMMLFICHWISTAFSSSLLKSLNGISRHSYFMYLLHGPIIYYVLQPYLGDWFRTNVNAIPMVLSAVLFVILVYLIVEGTARLVSGIRHNRHW